MMLVLEVRIVLCFLFHNISDISLSITSKNEISLIIKLSYQFSKSLFLDKWSESESVFYLKKGES